MGRRSTKTTKTGKFMNPTDQWRKQCRKKELKKNKQQRSAVREAVIKNKNPHAILAEIEEIEKMEIEAGPEELPTEKGLKEKKRKLHETLQRIILFYDRQDPRQAQRLKDLVVDSERKRREMTKVYNSYRSARSQIAVSDIPLPDSGGTTGENVAPSEIPMPQELEPDDEGSPVGSPGLSPPGPPPGPPPSVTFPKAIVIEKSVHFLEDDDNSNEESSEEEEESSDEVSSENEEELDQIKQVPPPPPPGPPPPGRTHPYSTHPLPLFAPPQYPPSVGFSTTPHPLFQSPPANKPHIQSSPIISAVQQSKQPAIISAQPQLRNVQAEVTKFMPTSLRVRRDQPKALKSKMRSAPSTHSNDLSKSTTSSRVNPGIQGDAYEAFMSEMQELL